MRIYPFQPGTGHVARPSNPYDDQRRCAMRPCGAARPRHIDHQFVFAHPLRGSAVVLACAVLLAAVLLVGCGSSTGGYGSTNTTHYAYPRGADDLVLGITVGGGLIGPQASFTQLPMTTLTGDGRFITVGPHIEIYPGPAMPNLRQQVLTANGIQTVLNAAREAGLMVPDRKYGRPPVADAPTTTFTVVVGAGRFVSRVYALGMESGGATTDLSNDDLRHRQQLLDFEAKLSDLTTWLGSDVGPDEQYTVTKLAVLARDVPADWTDPSGIQPNTLDWPLGDLATAQEHDRRQRRRRRGRRIGNAPTPASAGHPDHAVAERRQDLPADLPSRPAGRTGAAGSLVAGGRPEPAGGSPWFAPGQRRVRPWFRGVPHGIQRLLSLR